MDENDRLLEEAITEAFDRIKKLPNGSKERAEEVANLEKLYRVRNEKYRNEMTAFNDEQKKDAEFEIEKEKIQIEKEKIEIEKEKLKNEKNPKLKKDTLVNLGGFGILTLLGVLIEKREGILLNPVIRNLPGKIKFW